MFAERPRRAGLVLRKTFYPALLGRCGRNVVFGQNVVLRHPHKIHIGDNVVIDDNCLLDAKGETNRGIAIGSGVFIGRNTILSCKNGDIDVEDGANIGFNCELFSASRVRIGREHAARRVLLRHRRRPRLQRSGGRGAGTRPPLAGVDVGEGAWLGAGAKVLDGVTSATAPSLAPAPSFANRFPRARSPSASRRDVVIGHREGAAQS